MHAKGTQSTFYSRYRQIYEMIIKYCVMKCIMSVIEMYHPFNKHVIMSISKADDVWHDLIMVEIYK